MVNITPCCGRTFNQRRVRIDMRIGACETYPSCVIANMCVSCKTSSELFESSPINNICDCGVFFWLCIENAFIGMIISISKSFSNDTELCWSIGTEHQPLHRVRIDCRYFRIAVEGSSEDDTGWHNRSHPIRIDSVFSTVRANGLARVVMLQFYTQLYMCESIHYFIYLWCCDVTSFTFRVQETPIRRTFQLHHTFPLLLCIEKLMNLKKKHVIRPTKAATLQMNTTLGVTFVNVTGACIRDFILPYTTKSCVSNRTWNN